MEKLCPLFLSHRLQHPQTDSHTSPSWSSYPGRCFGHMPQVGERGSSCPLPHRSAGQGKSKGWSQKAPSWNTLYSKSGQRLLLPWNCSTVCCLWVLRLELVCQSVGVCGCLAWICAEWKMCGEQLVWSNCRLAFKPLCLLQDHRVKFSTSPQKPDTTFSCCCTSTLHISVGPCSPGLYGSLMCVCACALVRVYALQCVLRGQDMIKLLWKWKR